MTRPLNILFLCTGNSARSILAEALTNQLGAAHFRAYSAGSHPRGEVHPMALQVLQEAGLPIAGLRSKSWDEFAAADAPALDIIITVCDNAAGEVCPVWPGHPIAAHWGIDDPAAAVGSDDQIRLAFNHARELLQQRIMQLLALQPARLDPQTLQSQLQAIGQGQ